MSSIVVLLAACGGGSGGDSSTAGAASGNGTGQGTVPTGTTPATQTGAGASSGAPAAAVPPSSSADTGGTDTSGGNSASNPAPASPSTPSPAFTLDATARFNTPGDLAFGRDGNLYVMDKGNARIRRVSPNGEVGTIPGTYAATYDELASDASGNLSVLSNTEIFTLAPDGSRTSLAAYPPQPGSYLPLSISRGAGSDLHVLLRYRNTYRVAAVDSGGTERTLYASMTPGDVTRIAADAQGNIAIGINGPLREMNSFKLVPASAQPAEGQASGVVDVSVNGNVNNLVYDRMGNLYAVTLEWESTGASGPSAYRVFGMRVLRIGPDRTVTTLATGFPDGSESYTQSAITAAQVGLALDAAGNLYVSNPFNHAIYRLDGTGRFVLVAGKAGEAGSSD